MINSPAAPAEQFATLIAEKFDGKRVREYERDGKKHTYVQRFHQHTDNTRWLLERGRTDIRTDEQLQDDTSSWTMELGLYGNDMKPCGPGVTIYGAELGWRYLSSDDDDISVKTARVTPSSSMMDTLEQADSFADLVKFAVELAILETAAVLPQLHEVARAKRAEYKAKHEARATERAKRVQVANLISAAIPTGEPVRVTLKDRKTPLVCQVTQLENQPRFALEASFLSDTPKVNMDDIVKIEAKASNGRFEDAVLVTELLERELA